MSRMPKDEPPKKAFQVCRTCKFWRLASQGGTFGLCTEPGGKVILDMPTVRAVEQIRMTTDLTVCSAWVGKE